jgi:hypothetical protein
MSSSSPSEPKLTKKVFKESVNGPRKLSSSIESSDSSDISMNKNPGFSKTVAQLPMEKPVF